MRKGKNWVIVTILAILIVLIVAVYAVQKSYTTSTRSSSGSGGGTQQRVIVTEDNLDSFLASQPLLSQLPEGANIHLEIGNIDYILTKGSITRGTPTNPDMTLWISGEYISVMGNGLCNTVKAAKANGDLVLDYSISKTKLLFKYRKMLEYRECIGL